MINNVDYAATHFKYPTPTPINGEPANKSVKRLKAELRANDSSVDIYLGGGDHGYLGLILTNEEYTRISPTPTPFKAPLWPGTLQLDATATPTEAIHARKVHN